MQEVNISFITNTFFILKPYRYWFWKLEAETSHTGCARYRFLLAVGHCVTFVRVEIWHIRWCREQTTSVKKRHRENWALDLARSSILKSECQKKWKIRWSLIPHVFQYLISQKETNLSTVSKYKTQFRMTLLIVHFSLR